MLSISQTLSFSFCKRTIILGSALLFFLILGCFGLTEFSIFMTEQNVKPTLSATGECILPVAFFYYVNRIFF
jgi:hypothetical protein